MKLTIKYDIEFAISQPVFMRVSSAPVSTVGTLELTTDAAQELVLGLAAQLGWKIDRTDTVARFKSPRVPAGYNTILGYLAEKHPSFITQLGEEGIVASTQRDGFWCKHRCAKRGLRVLKVKAPEAAKAEGFDKVNAYPVEVIAERFNDI